MSLDPDAGFDNSKLEDDIVRPPNEEILLKQLEDLQTRSNEFVTEIERLRADAKKREHDTTEAVNILESKVKTMDKQNKFLASELKMLTLKQIADKKGMKRHFEVTLKQAERMFLEKESDLLSNNKSLMQEVSDLTQFKKVRGDLATELQATKETITRNDDRHKQQLGALSRKFYEARDRLEREAEARIAHSRQVYKEEVGKELDMDSKRIRRENRNMEKELMFQREITETLEKDKLLMKDEIKKLRLELHRTSHKDDAFALKGLKQNKQMQELAEKITTLEKSLTQVVNEGNAEKASRENHHQKRLSTLQKQIKGHSQAAVVKARELQAIKHHAQTILQQRNQVEKIFLKALDHVKGQVIASREDDYKHALHLYQRTLKTMNRPMPDGNYLDQRRLGPPPKPPKRTLALKDMTREDRVSCLRLAVEWAKKDPEACAIVGSPFTDQDAFEQESMGFSDNLPGLGPDASAPGIASWESSGALTFLTGAAANLNLEESERELDMIM